MGRQSKLAYLISLLLFLGGCSVQEPPVEKDISENVAPEPEPQQEEVAEPEAPAETQSIIPSVEDEVVDAQETPIEVAPPAEEPEPEPEEVVAPADDNETIAEDLNESEMADTIVETDREAVFGDESNMTEVTPEEDNTTLETEPPEEEMISVEAFEPFEQQIGVLKIDIGAESLKIKMNDPIIKYFSLPTPDRIVIDFKDIRYLEPMTAEIRSPYVNKIATAAHDNYNRVVIYLNEAIEYTISKEAGGWLVSFKK